MITNNRFSQDDPILIMARDKTGGLPPLEWLRVFEAAGRSGSFTAAARELGLTQAAVSQRMRNLEAWLGCSLFERKARGVELTMAGESYLPHVRDALVSLTLSTGDLFAEAPRDLRIMAQPSHIELLVCRRLAAFQSACPEVRTTVVSAWHQRDFDDGGVAVQLRFGRGDWPETQAVLLHQEVLAPLASPNLLATDLEGWRRAPVIEVVGARPGWSHWASETGAALPRRARLSFDSMGYGLRAAERGLGVVLGSTVLADGLLGDGQLVRLPAPQVMTKSGYWLTWPKGFVRSSRQELQLAALRQALSGDGAASLRGDGDASVPAHDLVARGRGQGNVQG